MNITNAKNRLLSEINIKPIGQLPPKFMTLSELQKWLKFNDEEFEKLYNAVTRDIVGKEELLTWIRQNYGGEKLQKLLRYYSNLDEDIKDFQIGQTSKTKTGKHIITDINPETQSVTWVINNKINDSDIHDDLSNLINKLEGYREDYNNEKRLNSLLQKLKFIRNTFKRTSI
jgi:hypothetical protein